MVSLKFLFCSSLSLTYVVRGENKMNKALVWNLGSIKELGNCGLHFRGFKELNTLHWMHLKVRNNKKVTKKGLRN